MIIGIPFFLVIVMPIVQTLINITDEECEGLIDILKSLTEKVYNYRDNIRVYGWVKHTTTIPLDNSKLLEQQKFLEQHQNPEGSGN
jgi:hypothetical protein